MVQIWQSLSFLDCWQIYPQHFLTSCGQDEFKFGRSTLELPEIPPSKFSGGQDEFKFGRSTPDLLADTHWTHMLWLEDELQIWLDLPLISASKIYC